MEWRPRGVPGGEELPGGEEAEGEELPPSKKKMITTMGWRSPIARWL
jgi:hypothetical protein